MNRPHAKKKMLRRYVALIWRKRGKVASEKTERWQEILSSTTSLKMFAVGSYCVQMNIINSYLLCWPSLAFRLANGKSFSQSYLCRNSRKSENTKQWYLFGEPFEKGMKQIKRRIFAKISSCNACGVSLILKLYLLLNLINLFIMHSSTKHRQSKTAWTACWDGTQSWMSDVTMLVRSHECTRGCTHTHKCHCPSWN